MHEDHSHGHDRHEENSQPTGAFAGTTFTVADMTCGHCVGTVRSAIERALPGAKVSVSLDTHRVVVDGDAAKAAEAIREAGYTPELVTG